MSIERKASMIGYVYVCVHQAMTAYSKSIPLPSIQIDWRYGVVWYVIYSIESMDGKYVRKVWKVRRVLMGGWSGYVRGSHSIHLPAPPLPPSLPPTSPCYQPKLLVPLVSLPRCLEAQSTVTPQLPRSVTNCLDGHIGPKHGGKAALSVTSQQ